MNNNNWMTCTACKKVVILNATGICLGCQSGFSGQMIEDRYVPLLEEKELKTRDSKESRIPDKGQIDEY